MHRTSQRCGMVWRGPILYIGSRVRDVGQRNAQTFGSLLSALFRIHFSGHHCALLQARDCVWDNRHSSLVGRTVLFRAGSAEALAQPPDSPLGAKFARRLLVAAETERFARPQV